MKPKQQNSAGECFQLYQKISQTEISGNNLSNVKYKEILQSEAQMTQYFLKATDFNDAKPLPNQKFPQNIISATRGSLGDEAESSCQDKMGCEANKTQNSLLRDLRVTNLDRKRDWITINGLSSPEECLSHRTRYCLLKPNNRPTALLGQNTRVDDEKVSQKIYFIESCQIRGIYKSGNIIRLRGGSPQALETATFDYSTMLKKFHGYRDKILNDKVLDEELSLFIEPSIITERSNNENEPVELSFDIKKHFLYLEKGKTSKILLLTGQAGTGKSFFCKYFQKELMSNWISTSQNSESEYEKWFPIYVQFSTLKNPKSEAIPETLARELSLTQEEIMLLQNSNADKSSLPHLLFIFDGYEDVQSIHGQRRPKSDQEYINQNFCVLNKIEGESWENAKFIITCTEENLRRIERKDLLFAPIRFGLKKLSSIPGSLLERKLEPFSDHQIACYLKKFLSSKQRSSEIEDKDLEFSISLSRPPSSWSAVEKLEKMIHEYDLREVAKIPFMLNVTAEVLIRLGNDQNVTQIADPNSNKPTSPKTLNILFLMEYYVEEVINSIAHRIIRAEGGKDSEEEETSKKQMRERLKLEAQSLALRLCGFSKKPLDSQAAVEENSLHLELYPLIQQESKLSNPKFSCSILRDFFVAQSIEGEMMKMSSLVKNESVKLSKESLLNQRIFTCQGILFLREAINEGRLKSEQFVNLVLLSRQKEQHHHQDAEFSNFESPFAIAAANAITILNAAGYDFSNQDLSNICIPYANLSYGIFEGTNFANTKLQGVEFTGAWLKDAYFEKTNLKEGEFGELASLKFKGAKNGNIALSLNGKFFAVETKGNQTVIFENYTSRYQEIRRLPGAFPKKFDNPFSQDGKQIITVEENRGLVLWDILSGQSLQRAILPTDFKRLVHFNSVQQEFMSYNSGNFQKYSATSESWVDLPFNKSLRVTDSLISSDCNRLLLIGSKGIILYNIALGKPILKFGQREYWSSCKLNQEGKIMALRTMNGVTRILDSFRGYGIKYLFKATDNISVSQNLDGDTSLDFHETLLFLATKNGITIQDIASASVIHSLQFEEGLTDAKYSFNFANQQIALVKKHLITFTSFARVNHQLEDRILSIRGANSKGLNIKGAVLRTCAGLSDENIAIFEEKGEYGCFNEDLVTQLCTDRVSDPQTIREIILIAEKLTAIQAKIISYDAKWTNLIKLDLSKNKIGEEGGQAIGINQSWINLEELALVQTEIGDKTAMTLAENHSWKNLKRLRLAWNVIGNPGATAIGKCKLWVSLEVLELHQNCVEDEGALAIGENLIWKNLTKIDLSFNKISDQKTLHLICRNSTWMNLKIIHLHKNPAPLQEEEMLKIIEIIPSNNLMELTLAQAKINQDLLQCLKYYEPKDVFVISASNKGFTGMDGLVIGSNATWINLKRFDFSQNKIGDEGGVKIGSNASWVNLEDLDLSEAGLGANSGMALGGNEAWLKLKMLNLNGNKLGIEGACRLGANLTWADLQVLRLQSNSIGAGGAGGLSKNAAWVNLQILELYGNEIGDAGVRELSKNTSWANLQKLDVGFNLIGDEGAGELSKNEAWNKLQTLILVYNKIGNQGAGELGKNQAWINLEALDLYGNQIGDAGAEQLSKNASWTKLRKLDLGYNKIGTGGAEKLKNNPHWPCLSNLST